MNDKNETYKKQKLHDLESIQDNLDDPSFLNVCILQRHARSHDVIDEVSDAVEEIKEQIMRPPFAYPDIGGTTNSLKELFLVISMFGPDGADCYKFISPHSLGGCGLRVM